MISLHSITKVFGDTADGALARLDEGAEKDSIREETGATVAVRDASLEIHEHETFAIMGRSGSGKSTLLRCLNGLVRPTRGTVTVAGTDVSALDADALRAFCREHLAMVFQHFGLFPHRSVRGNVGFGLEVAGTPSAERADRVDAALEQVGLAGYANERPDRLSGGMQQRVGLARALATDPRILLMDEPFSALDPLIRTELQDELLRLQRESPRTVVFITHDLDEALRLGDRVAIMEAGRIVQVGTPADIVLRPADAYVRDFVENVDRTRVLTARALVTPDANAPDTAPTVDADTPLATALPLLLDTPTIRVLANGSPVGVLTREAVREVLEG